MFEWLTDEWFEGTRSLVGGGPDVSGLSARVQYTVTGGPRGDIGFYRVITDGRLVDSAPGELPDAQVVLTAGWADAVRLQRGELDPATAFMQGRVKATGDMAVVMGLLPATLTPEFRAVQREVAAVTAF